MAEDIKNSRRGVLVTDEFIDVMCDCFSVEEIGITMRAVFDEVRGRTAKLAGLGPTAEAIYKVFLPSVIRLRKQSDDKAKAGAANKGRAPSANTDKNTVSNSEENPTNRPTDQPNQPTNISDPDDRLAKRERLFPRGGKQ